MTLHPLPGQRPKLADEIFHDLQRQILEGALPPGERLPPERELAERYGANRNTLREALRRLEQLRLVTVRHGHGVTVADFRRTGTLELLGPFLRAQGPSPDAAAVVLDLLLARLQVLESAVRLAAERATPEDAERLEQLAADQADALNAGDRARLVAGDLALVDILVDAAHSLPARWTANTLLEVYRDLTAQLPDLWVLEPGFLGYLHRMLDALRAHDVEAAVEATREHYRRVDARVLSMLTPLLDAAGGEADARQP
jgi:GntR family transcriptional repressor for pyruvate dehydrogenase complex